jgi:uncharacterized protein (DUF1778 family)
VGASILHLLVARNGNTLISSHNIVAESWAKQIKAKEEAFKLTQAQWNKIMAVMESGSVEELEQVLGRNRACE